MRKDYSIKSIPQEYLDEFFSGQAGFVKKRVFLLCVMSMLIYLLGTFLSLILLPSGFNTAEMPIIIELVIGAMVVIFLNSRLKTLKSLKMNALFFTFIVVMIAARLNMLYHSYLQESSSVYLFTMLLISFTIPWKPSDILYVAGLHIASFIHLYMIASRRFPLYAQENFSYETLVNGVIFLVMGMVFALIVRKKESGRDIESFILYKDIEEKNQQIRRELEFAGRIQNTLVPRSVSTKEMDVAVTYYPMDFIGGDFAKFHFIDPKNLICFISDVTGHGVSAALMVNRLHTEFERILVTQIYPSKIVNKLNDFIIKDFEGTGMYLTAFCCLIDLEKCEMVYANCGHPTQYICKYKNDEIEDMGSISPMLGIPFADNDFKERSVNFGKGDKLLLFTDGVIEAKNTEGDEYSRVRLEDFIKNNHDKDAVSFNKLLMDELSGFSGKTFSDDIFIMSACAKQ